MASLSIPAKMDLARLRGTARAMNRLASILSFKHNQYLATTRKKALIIGINYTQRGPQLFKSVADAIEAKRTLMDVFAFKQEDIVLLVDEEGGSDQPTHARILHELQNFVESDDNVNYVFIYVGHANQSDVKSERAMQVEEDGKSEYIIPPDALSPRGSPIISKVIYDYTLRSYLVDRLGHGSKLLAIFNTAHSGTLLNLRHYKCHRRGKFTNSVYHLGRKGLCGPFQMMVVRKASASNQPAGIVSHVAHKFPWRLQPAQAKAGDLCTGLCHLENRWPKYPRVVSISACRDSEMGVESLEELSMLASLMQLLRDNPQPTFREVMNNIRANVKQTRFRCVENDSSNAENGLNRKRGNRLLATVSHTHRHVFTKLKPWNPEIAAEHTIDMKQKMMICLP